MSQSEPDVSAGDVLHQAFLVLVDGLSCPATLLFLTLVLGPRLVLDVLVLLARTADRQSTPPPLDSSLPGVEPTDEIGPRQSGGTDTP